MPGVKKHTNRIYSVAACFSFFFFFPEAAVCMSKFNVLNFLQSISVVLTNLLRV